MGVKVAVGGVQQTFIHCDVMGVKVAVGGVQQAFIHCDVMGVKVAVGGGGGGPLLPEDKPGS